MDENEVDVDEQLRIIRGGVVPWVNNLSPLTVARLLFEEGQELVYSDRVLRYVVYRGPDTGVSIRDGRETIPFRSLNIPADMSVVSVASTGLVTGEVYDHKSGNRNVQWGILLLGADSEDKAHWLWVTMWKPFGPDSTCVELDIESLAELITGSDDHEPILHPLLAYTGFNHLLERKMVLYQRVVNNLGCHFWRNTWQLDRMIVMDNPSRATD